MKLNRRVDCTFLWTGFGSFCGRQLVLADRRQTPWDWTGFFSEEFLSQTFSNLPLTFCSSNSTPFPFLCFDTNGHKMILLHCFFFFYPPSLLLVCSLPLSVLSVSPALCNEALLLLSPRQAVIITSKVKQTAVRWLHIPQRHLLWD